MTTKLILSLALLFSLTATASVESFYGKVIHSDISTRRQLPEVIDDLQHHLQLISHDSILINTADTTWQQGICLIKLDRIRDTAYDKRLDKLNADMFLLRSDGRSSMQIIAYSYAGLTNGIYTYLDLLGFRWFHPGDLWTHTPDRRDITLTIDSAFRPDFLLRSFSGTYGTPRNTVIDKTAYVDHQWAVWARRNRQGGDYNLRGHAWNEFIWYNLDSLKLHPEYMALVDSHRVVPTTAAKFCLSNKAFRDLFVRHQLSLLAKDMKGYHDGTHYFESVESSDGGGDCQCENCQKMGSNTTRIFILANEVARAFREISPLAGVNLYAYNTHADTPNVAIEPNVTVQIIPYKYQTIMAPEQMIEAWEKKKDELFIYDYYGLPILNIDMPVKGGFRAVPYIKNRVLSWPQHHIKGSLLETSYSIGATGLALYLYTRVGWQLNTNIDHTMDEYYKMNYGKAAKAMRLAYDMLGDTIDNRRALYNAVTVITTQVHEKQLTSDQVKRVVVIKSYLHYLKLVYDYKRYDKKEEPQMSDSLVRYAHSVFHRMVINQFALVEYMWNYGPTPAYLKKYWDVYHVTAPACKFSSVVQYTDEQIEKAFDEDYRQLRLAIPPKDRALPGKPCCQDTEDDL